MKLPTQIDDAVTELRGHGLTVTWLEDGESDAYWIDVGSHRLVIPRSQLQDWSRGRIVQTVMDMIDP